MSDYANIYNNNNSENLILDPNAQQSIEPIPIASNSGFQTLVVPSYSDSAPTEICEVFVMGSRVLITEEDKSAALYSLKSTLNNTKDSYNKTITMALAASVLYGYIVAGAQAGNDNTIGFSSTSAQTIFALPYLASIIVGFGIGYVSRKNESSTLGMAFTVFCLTNLLVQLGIVGTQFLNDGTAFSAQVGLILVFLMGLKMLLSTFTQSQMYELKEDIIADLKK